MAESKLEKYIKRDIQSTRAQEVHPEVVNPVLGYTSDSSFSNHNYVITWWPITQPFEMVSETNCPTPPPPAGEKEAASFPNIAGTGLCKKVSYQPDSLFKNSPFLSQRKGARGIDLYPPQRGVARVEGRQTLHKTNLHNKNILNITLKTIHA